MVREEVTTLDLRGKFVLPGLIDCHVHLSGSGEADSQFQVPTGQMALKILKNAQRNLAAGITTVRDLVAGANLNSMYAAPYNAATLPVPRMCLAGDLSPSLRQGRLLYWHVSRGRWRGRVRKAVREQVKHGADLIRWV